MDDYSKYEAECEKVRAANSELLLGFANSLKAANLKASTIDRHVENVEFYVNVFLLYSDIIEAKDGASEISEFLGYWFIKKAMWASPGHIKGNAASLKKFYKFMHESGQISKEDFDDLKSTIKDEMPEWIATLSRYDNPSIDSMAEVWGF